MAGDPRQILFMLRVEELIGRRVNTARVKMKLRAASCAVSSEILQSPQPSLLRQLADSEGSVRLHPRNNLRSIRRRRIIILAAFIIFGFILFYKFASAQVKNCCYGHLPEPFCAEVENANPCPDGYPFKATGIACDKCDKCGCRGSIAPPDVTSVTPVTPNSSPPGSLEQPKESPPVLPTLQIPIPGLTFTNKIEFCSSNPDLTDMSQCPAGDRVFVVPWLGQYIIAIYKWALRAVVILAIFMIMLGGVQWIVSRGSPAGITSAKSKIGASIIAVVIILCVNIILSLINPELTILKPITIGRIATIDLEIEELNMNSSIIRGRNCPDLTPDNTKSCKSSEIVAIAESFLGQNSGPCHCACFVSRVLRAANCGLNSTFETVPDLESWLVAHGWTKKDGKDGVSTGDVVAKDGHLGLAINSSKIIDSGIIHEGKTENGCTQKAVTCPNVWHGLNNPDGTRYWEGGGCISNQTIKERSNFFTRYWINPNR